MVKQYEELTTTLSVYENKVRGVYPARFHKDVELVMVWEGSLEFMIDGANYTLHAGDLCAIFPNVLHAITAQQCKKTMILVSPALVPAVAEQKPGNPVIRAQQLDPIVPALFQRCLQLFREGNQSLLLQHINSILGELLPLLCVDKRSTSPELVHQIVEFILEHYNEPITLEQLAKKTGYSKYHISRTVADTFGCNFRTLVNNYRISAAEEMLLHKEKSVAEIGGDCGFQNQSTFNRVFLQQCGMTPREYRSRNGGR